MQPFTILALGLLLGLRHATDSDHVVAVTTIVSKKRSLRHAALVGIAWGIGHTIMIIVVGVAIIVFHVAIPEKTQALFEFLVALALIALGVLNLTGMLGGLMRTFSRISPHTHFHLHDHMHVHIHAHPERIDESPGRAEELAEFIRIHGLFQLVRPLVVGLIHGLAGSAAVALLIVSSIRSTTVGVLYLAIFGIGTILGMMIITTLLGIPIIGASQKFRQFDKSISWISGAVSLLFGSYLAYTIGFTQGLFIR